MKSSHERHKQTRRKLLMTLLLLSLELLSKFLGVVDVVLSIKRVSCKQQFVVLQ